MAGEGLTAKQRLFVEHFLGRANSNATQAAILAGYPERSAASVGWENLRKPEIAAAISARYAEAALPANETLARLGEQARNEASRFFDVSDGRGYVDLQGLKDAGLMHLVKGIKNTEHGQEILFYDAQAALVQIGRHHKLFTDKTEHGGEIGIIERAAQTLRQKLLPGDVEEGAEGMAGEPGGA